MVFLEDFWNGDIEPMEHRFFPKEEYAKVFHRIERYEEAIKAELSETGLTALEEFKQAQLDSASLIERDSFIGGFRMGARVIMDVLLEPSRISSR